MERLKRGDVVTVAAHSDYTGKPRPAVIVQSNLFNPTHASITLCLITSELRDAPLFRPTIQPTVANGLKKVSQIMIDKIASVKRSHIDKKIGHLDNTTLRELDQILRLWLQLR
jgi:mRNA interferase MazF